MNFTRCAAALYAFTQKSSKVSTRVRAAIIEAPQEACVAEIDNGYTAVNRAELNDAQFGALVACSKQAFTIVRGPPGSGKTSLAKHIVTVWSTGLGGTPDVALVAADSNLAINNVLDKVTSGTDRILAYRAYSYSARAKMQRDANTTPSERATTSLTTGADALPTDKRDCAAALRNAHVIGATAIFSQEVFELLGESGILGELIQDSKSIVEDLESRIWTSLPDPLSPLHLPLPLPPPSPTLSPSFHSPFNPSTLSPHQKNAFFAPALF